MTANPARTNLLLSVALICFGVIFRLLPHPANIAPVGAIALFAGSKLPKSYAFGVIILTMLISDVLIGTHSVMVYTWGAYAFIALLSGFVLKKSSILRVAGMTISSSFIFFVISNFGVWIHSGMYAHTVAGFSQTYVMALPFYQNTMLGDTLFTTLLFGGYWLCKTAAKSQKVQFSLVRSNS